MDKKKLNDIISIASQVDGVEVKKSQSQTTDFYEFTVREKKVKISNGKDKATLLVEPNNIVGVFFDDIEMKEEGSSISLNLYKKLCFVFKKQIGFLKLKK